MLFLRKQLIKVWCMKTTRLIFRFYCRLWLLAFLILNTRLLADDASQWKVQVTGVRIVAPPADSKENSRGAFFAAPGVSVAAMLTPANGKIVSIDQFSSKLDSFTDDKGTDLLAVKSEDPFNKPGFGMMDNKETYATVEIQSAGLPAKGAAALNI